MKSLQLSHLQLSQTNQGQKIKFTAVTKMVSSIPDIINQLNDAMDDPMSENISTKYYEPYELAPVMKNTTHIVSFFHLNISSLYFHKEELTTLISEHNF